MSRSDNSYGLILASSPKFKEVFGKSNVSRAADLPFLIESRKFNYQRWYAKHTDIHGQRELILYRLKWGYISIKI